MVRSKQKDQSALVVVAMVLIEVECRWRTAPWESSGPVAEVEPSIMQ